jgi:transposase InsO family protein
MESKSEEIALFRYGLIAPLVIEPLPRGELTRRAREIAAHHYDIPYSTRAQISVDTLLDWAQRYRDKGLAGLAPQARSDRGVCRAIPDPVADLIERLKRENPYRSGATLLRELALSSGSAEPPVSASSLYRFLKARGLSTRELLRSTTLRKKFEAEFANQIWQSDMLFGPYVARAEGGKQQAFLYGLIDDASRLIPHAQFYTSEGLDSLLDCTRQGVAARGLPVRYYADNGKVYRSGQLARIAASLGVLIVHTPPYQPEGRGKIERWFKTVREQFLANLDCRRLTLEELNQRLWAWIEVYHRTLHSSLGLTPLARWQRDIEKVRQVPPSTDLRRLFFYRVARQVRRDLTFRLANRFYEAPAHLAGRSVEVRFDPLDLGQVDLYLNNEPQGEARPVDAVVNASLPRDRSGAAGPQAPPEPTGINYVELIKEQAGSQPRDAHPGQEDEADV